ncbi:hypothetical protein Back2_15190 [Nocardioides baekrokdamisoli]|uniref:Bacterial SCP orthologue domain-containing protein n=1 Tax=Nocardioides baekrokdamisoli TaxID=1804624 RepID=A0A3G9IG41_9ACTN|nr:sterol carrier family protein [Nocardioides baekrokdamisoli]BBH17232.1 hypothetical protein Back2_15190 [Nocardioides baekrokdamisoli]
MSRRLQPLDPVALAAAVEAADRRALTKHYLAVLESRAPGKSVEVRIPPYAAIQCIEGVRHTRGTPPAVIEMDPDTWIATASGALPWADAVASGKVRASGERTDLSTYLPLS